MTTPAPDIARNRIIEKLKSSIFPRSLPNPPSGELQGRETIRIGVGPGKQCDGCEEMIDADEASLAQAYDYGTGGVYRFHDSCWKVWNEERHRPRLRESKG